MLRPSAILGVLIAVGSFTLPATASGDSPVDIANMSEQPQVVIKRILESERSDEAKLDALARFVKVGDRYNEFGQKLGRPIKVLTLDDTPFFFCYESGLFVGYHKGKVTGIGYYDALNKPFELTN